MYAASNDNIVLTAKTTIRDALIDFKKRLTKYSWMYPITLFLICSISLKPYA
jgi:hypothetical protein